MAHEKMYQGQDWETDNPNLAQVFVILDQIEALSTVMDAIPEAALRDRGREIFALAIAAKYHLRRVILGDTTGT